MFGGVMPPMGGPSCHWNGVGEVIVNVSVVAMPRGLCWFGVCRQHVGAIIWGGMGQPGGRGGQPRSEGQLDESHCHQGYNV